MLEVVSHRCKTEEVVKLLLLLLHSQVLLCVPILRKHVRKN